MGKEKSDNCDKGENDSNPFIAKVAKEKRKDARAIVAFASFAPLRPSR
jgi:hypothetical protein